MSLHESTSIGRWRNKFHLPKEKDNTDTDEGASVDILESTHPIIKEVETLYTKMSADRECTEEVQP